MYTSRFSHWLAVAYACFIDGYHKTSVLPVADNQAYDYSLSLSLSACI